MKLTFAMKLFNAVLFLPKKIFLVIFFLLYLGISAQPVLAVSNDIQNNTFIWTDNALTTEKLNRVFIISGSTQKNQLPDTIFAFQFNPLKNDTIQFLIDQRIHNPVYIEFEYKDLKKNSNSFILLPNSTYSITEKDDNLIVKLRPLVFDTLNTSVKILYSFLFRLVIELLIAFPIALLFKLPSRLYFFVLVANIMSFPVLYVSFIPLFLKELLTIFLEGVFIFLIGWKRLKLRKAIIISFLLNTIRFGIAKVIMLIVKIL